MGAVRLFSASHCGSVLPLLDRLLYSVLPPSVANELRHKRPVPAKRYDNVTILFSGIVGFNTFCSKHASGEGAMKIVNLLNDLYTRFDTLTDSRKNPFVYKASPDPILTPCFHYSAFSDPIFQRPCSHCSLTVTLKPWYYQLSCRHYLPFSQIITSCSKTFSSV